MSPVKSGKKSILKESKEYLLPDGCGVSTLTAFLADGNASFLRAARSGNLEKVIEFLKGNIDINTSNANGLNALHLAAKEGHVSVVTELLKRGANVNAATKKGNTALHIASLAGQKEVVKVLIQLGANVNVQSQNGFTPLYMAAQENHDTVVSFLLANGANQSLATEDGFTPLAVALQQGHDKVVAVLLENDTKGKVRLPALHIAAKKDDCKAATLLLQSDHNPDVTSKSGFTPLHIAAHYGNENIAKILLSKGADVNYAAKHQITPLHVASKWGKTNMVVLLLEKGANIEAATRDGLTPLHCAARSGHDQVVDLLLEKGAPFLAKTKNGLAPLHMASQGDHVDSARILLYHKAPVDDVTVDYLTALHVAAHCGHVKVAKLLLDRKADPNARALNGFTPLHIACKKNRIKVVELLLKHGASIEATTESGLTPLHVASFMGCMNIVIYLIQNGANPDVPTVRGETPLHLAARANQTDIIRILLRNGASVDARAREEQTPLHIAARLGNVDIVSLLLQHGAAVDAVTKDMYTALHITAKEDQEEVAAALLDHGASLTATTKKGFTPLHLAAKYGNIKVARLLLQKGAPVDAQGKNGVTPLHVASHYDHVNVALLLLDKGASPHAMAKNGYTPLHIAAKKNQMDIASTLLEYGANTNSESKAGFTPLHLASQEGHSDMSSLLIEHKANVNHKANNGLTPLHLCSQEDRVNVATILVKNGAEIGPQTKAGYTPLHVASHFGQINMVRFLLQNDANVHTVTTHGYTPLHQAAQQGHTLIVNLLLENQASPNVTTVQGQTPLSIAQRLGYISVVETLKVVTETTVTTTTTTVTEEKYKVVAPETMQETFMTDSEDEGGEEAMLGDQSYRYLTADEMKSLGDDSLPIDVTKDEKQQDVMQAVKQFGAPMVEEDNLSPQHITPIESGFSEKFSPDNIDLTKAPIHAGRFSMDDAYYYFPPKGMLRSRFLVSFMVDARGGAMRGCRHSGVRVIIPPRKASMPMRITCRYLRKEKLIHPPPLMEGEACASRILEMGPVGARFLGPVIIEVPHFASTRGKEREITILRSDTGESWREHTLEASEEAVQEVLNESFEGEELSALEDLNTNRITRILTTDFPQYFAIVTRIRQEVHGVGPEGGMVSSTVVPQVQAIFPEGALTKKIRVGLQAQPIAPELVAKLLGNRVAVSPIVTVEPRRRKFHKPITLTIPVPQATTKGMINQYSGDAPTLRLLCSITGGSSKAQWEDVTGSTPLTFVNDCVSFTTTVSARFWLMDCRQVNEVTRFATELYQEAVYVPFMSKFVIFAKRHDPFEAQLRVFCMTDDKEDKTLESQEHFTEVAKSRDVEVLEGKMQYLEFAGNLVPVTKSGEQLKLTFQAFHENRLPFVIRVKDPHAEHMGRIAFMKEPKAARGEPPQTPICNLNVALPEIAMGEANADVLELVTLEKSYDFIQEAGLSKPELIHRADLRLSDIARELDKDWVLLAQQLDIPEQDVEQIKAQTVCDQSEQARMMLRLWLQKSGSKATGNELEKGLRKINREDIIKNCMFNIELVTDDVEKAVAKVHLDQSGFDVFKEELGSSREASMRRGASLDVSYDEQDIMKEAESAAETSSETGSLFERDQISQALTDDRDECAIMSMHETVFSVTDSSFNNNKPVSDNFDYNKNDKILPNVEHHIIIENKAELDSSRNLNIENEAPSTQHSTLIEHDAYVLPEIGKKSHHFWPSDKIIYKEVPSPVLIEQSENESSAQDNKLPSENNFDENSPNHKTLNNKHNISIKLNEDLLNLDDIEKKDHVQEIFVEKCTLEPEFYEMLADENYSEDFIASEVTDTAENFFLEEIVSLPSEENLDKIVPETKQDIEFDAVLEPDSIIPETPNISFYNNKQNKSGNVINVIIEDVTLPDNFDESLETECESPISLQPVDLCNPVSPKTNNEQTSSDNRTFSVNQENGDELGINLEPNKDTYQPSYTEIQNQYNVQQSETNYQNVEPDIKNVSDKCYGFKPSEILDLGYFSLDKEASSNTCTVASKLGFNEPDLNTEKKDENLQNEEKISDSVSPDMIKQTENNAYYEICTLKKEVEHTKGNEMLSDLDENNSLVNLTCVSTKSENNKNPEEIEVALSKIHTCSDDGVIISDVIVTKPDLNWEGINMDDLNWDSITMDNNKIEAGLDIEKLQEISLAASLLPEAKDSDVKKPLETEIKLVDITVGDVIMPAAVQEIPAKLTESETWPSGDLDTSQVSVSSLPDDEKSEPTTATVSSTAVSVEVVKKTTPDVEKTEIDTCGTTTHIIQKTTHMTLITHVKADDELLEDGIKKSEISDDTVKQAVIEPKEDESVKEHVQQLHSETLIDDTDIQKLRDSPKITEDDAFEKEIDTVSEAQPVESGFVPCAFVNTAFAGAEIIDQVEQAAPIRARSPYEVIRGETSEQTSDVFSDEKKDRLGSFEKVTYITKHVEIRRRPVLQHIPSEISEEDLVEREITSPISKEEFDLIAADIKSGKTVLSQEVIDELNTEIENSRIPVVTDREDSTIQVLSTTQILTDIEDIKDLTQKPEELDDKISEEIKSKGDTSEYVAKTDDITSPESDTGIPTSPFDLISESDLSDIEHKSSACPLSPSLLKVDKDKSQDSVITTTLSQSIGENTISVSHAASSKDMSDSGTLNEKSELGEPKIETHVVVHTITMAASETKPLTNGPGEVEYQEDYDYDGETYSERSKKYVFEDEIYFDKADGESQEIEEAKQSHYSSVSDDVIDSEIREILSSDQQLEDIIERPVTPEPPKDSAPDKSFVEDLKNLAEETSEEALITEADDVYSNNETASPTSPDAKLGFAYGMQFEKYALDQPEEAMDVDSDQYSEEKETSYSYGMRFERDPDIDDEDIPCYGDLYTHEEEDEDALENGEKAKIAQKPSKDAEFDILAGRKYFTKNVEVDELSMSSLQEFERLEAEIVSGRKSSVGSIDSLNEKQSASKSGEHDDVSMNSLNEFERIEKEVTEGKIEPSMQESITQLSEIEEGHESQASEASQENKSETGKDEDVSIVEDYDDQLDNIDEIILQAESKETAELPFQFILKQSQKVEQTLNDGEISSVENRGTEIKSTEITEIKNVRGNVIETTKISSWVTSKSLENSSIGEIKDDLDQDSLRDELSLKPDSLIDDVKHDYQDSLHEERFDDPDSLQEHMDEMRDSLFEERHVEDDSLHEMDIMPDESSLSLEGSIAAVASLDSSKADEPVKLKITDLRGIKDSHLHEFSVETTAEIIPREVTTQISVSDIPKSIDIMQSSTDSLEQSSSAALAAFHLESESLMSSSLNSAVTSEDYTMVSSTDTLEQEGRITYRYEDIPVDDIEVLVRSGHKVIVDSEGNIQTHFHGKQYIETDEITNAALNKDVTEVKLPATTSVQVHSALTTVKYVNGDQEPHKPNIFHSTSDQGTDDTFYESTYYDPDVEVEEIETTDEFGNTKIIRKIKKVIHTKTQFSSSSSSKDVEEKLKEFLREHTAGDSAGKAEEEIEESKTTDDKGNVVVVRTVKQQIISEPEIHSRTFTGPNADEQSHEFVETFQTLDPTEDISEYEKVDEQGNVVRITKQYVVTPQVHTVSFSGPDAHKQMEEYMKQWNSQTQNLGEFEGDQQRTMLPALQISRSSEHSQDSIPTDTSSNLVHKVTGDTVVMKTVVSTLSTDPSDKTFMSESSTSTSISLETAKDKPSDSVDEKASLPK